MPAELAIYRPEEWPSPREHREARRQWLRGHGVDADDWRVFYPILRASKRAHARTPRELFAVDRMRVTADPASASDWWPPTGAPLTS